MKQEFHQELVPKMPASFSDAVDKAVFEAIGKENTQTAKERARTARGQKLRRYLAAAAAVVLLMVTAFTLGLGVYGNTFGALANSKGDDTRLDTIPLYSDPIPNATRYDLTEGYAYADQLFDLVQEDLAWLKETDYDELWLLAVEDLSKKDFSAVTYIEQEETQEPEELWSTGKEEEVDITAWMHSQNTLFALIQFEFGEGDGPMLVEFGLDEEGKPVSSTIKVLSCDPELDGTFSYNVEDYTSPYAYVGYGTGARNGQLACENYAMTLASALPLEQVAEKLSTSAHQSHIREWYLYTAPAQCSLQLWAGDGQEKVVCSGAIAKQTLSSNESVALRVTFDGETLYTKGTLVQSGLEAVQKQEKIQAYTQKMSRAWEGDYPNTFCLSVNQWEEHAMTMETNLPNATVKRVYIYQNTYGNSHWITEVPETVEGLLQLEPDKGENIVCFHVESEGKEYVFSFSMYLRSMEGLYGNYKQADAFTPMAKRYDLTGGFAYSDKLLDAVEAELQSLGINYEELWLEAVYDFDGKYELVEKQYGTQMWMDKSEGYCLALVQYDFSEGAGPMLVSFNYNTPTNVSHANILLETVDPNVDACYGVRLGDGDEPYTISNRYYCVGTDASSGTVCMERAVLKFTSQLPLEQVQELVKDSPYKDAAKEWYLLPLPDVGEQTLYDANGQERPLRKGNTVYDGNYEKEIQEPYVDWNA